MKRFLMACLIASFALSAFAVTPYQRRVLRSVALNLTVKCGAELELSPELDGPIKIISERGNVVTVEASYMEFGPFGGEFRFSYDFAARRVVPRSLVCLSN